MRTFPFRVSVVLGTACVVEVPTEAAPDALVDALPNVDVTATDGGASDVSAGTDIHEAGMDVLDARTGDFDAWAGGTDARTDVLDARMETRDARTDAPWNISVGPEIPLGEANVNAVPQADVSPDGWLHVVWLQGSGTSVTAAYRSLAPDETPGALRTVPGSGGSQRVFPSQFGPRVAAGEGDRAVVVFGLVTGLTPPRAAWHVHHVNAGSFTEWANFPAQDPAAAGFGEEAGVAVALPTDRANARAWVNYGYLTPRSDGAGDVMMNHTRAFLSGTMREGPSPTVNPPPPIAPWGKDMRYRAFGGDIWAASQFGQLMVQHGPAVAGRAVNGWETFRCSLAPGQSAGSPRPLFDRNGRPFVVYTEWHEVAARTSAPRQNYLATDPRDPCARRVPVGPAFTVAPADALVDGRFDIDGFGLGDGRLFLVWHEQVSAGMTSQGAVRYALVDLAAPSSARVVTLLGATDARFVTATRATPDGGGYVVYVNAARQVVARRVRRAP